MCVTTIQTVAFFQWFARTSADYTKNLWNIFCPHLFAAETYFQRGLSQSNFYSERLLCLLISILGCFRFWRFAKLWTNRRLQIQLSYFMVYFSLATTWLTWLFLKKERHPTKPTRPVARGSKGSTCPPASQKIFPFMHTGLFSFGMKTPYASFTEEGKDTVLKFHCSFVFLQLVSEQKLSIHIDFEKIAFRVFWQL